MRFSAYTKIWYQVKQVDEDQIIIYQRKEITKLTIWAFIAKTFVRANDEGLTLQSSALYSSCDANLTLVNLFQYYSRFTSAMTDAAPLFLLVETKLFKSLCRGK